MRLQSEGWNTSPGLHKVVKEALALKPRRIQLKKMSPSVSIKKNVPRTGWVDEGSMTQGSDPRACSLPLQVDTATWGSPPLAHTHKGARGHALEEIKSQGQGVALQQVPPANPHGW